MTPFRRIAIILLAVWVVSAAPVCSFSGEAGNRSVLILNSYYDDLKWMASQISAAKEILRDGFKQVEIILIK